MDRASGFLNPHIYIHNVGGGFLISLLGSTVYNLIRASTVSQWGPYQRCGLDYMDLLPLSKLILSK
jgi:hypothetical protein